MTATTLYAAAGMVLILIGLSGVLLRRNLLKIVLGFSVLGTGANLLIVSMGNIPGGTAPIVDRVELAGPGVPMVDPVTQALVLTAIVIGVGVTGLMLAYVIRVYARFKTLDVNRIRGGE